MTKERLKELIAIAAKVLELNKSVFTPDFINNSERILNYIQNNNEIRAALASLLQLNFSESASLITSAKEFVEMEKIIISGTVTEDVVAALNKLKERPVVLSVIAGLV
jgi:hypothetical protein